MSLILLLQFDLSNYNMNNYAETAFKYITLDHEIWFIFGINSILAPFLFLNLFMSISRLVRDDKKYALEKLLNTFYRIYPGLLNVIAYQVIIFLTLACGCYICMNWFSFYFWNFWFALSSVIFLDMTNLQNQPNLSA